MTRACGVALAALLVGCSWGTISPEDFKKQFGFSSSSSTPEVNVLSVSGMRQCVSKLRAAVGENNVHATELDVHTTYISLIARRPAQPTNVDSYECRHGEVGPRKTVRLSTVSTLDDDTFAFSDVDLDGLATRLDSVVSDLAIEGGAINVVNIRKVGPRGARFVSMKVSVSGAYKDVSIELDGRGQKVVSATPTSVNRATLGTAQLPADKYVAFDAPEIASLAAFDPDDLANGWALDVAHAWKSDAALETLGANDPAVDAAGHLAAESCSLRFFSATCLAAGESRCDLELLLGGEQARHVPSGVSVQTTTSGNVVLTKNQCSLRAALSAIAKLDPPFGAVDTAVLDTTRKPTWTFTRRKPMTRGDSGRYAQVDAITCALITK